ncbi:MAG: winged helix-turn-helix transcriptional regulator [Armatimonadetes bacterium]|nr:winged helix-turn-helix transcriptional regulator [Armatimonadota bacterium]
MTTDTLSDIFAALADPTRRAILEELTQGPRPMGVIARQFSISGPAVTKHLKVLERAGLVRSNRKAQSRLRSLDATRLEEAQQYIENYRQYWEQSFYRLDSFLFGLQTKEINDDNNH